MTASNRAESPSTVKLAPGVWAARADLRFSFSRSRGPGGQAVNKLNTRAELRVSIYAIVGLNEEALLRLRHAAGRRVNQNNELVIRAQTHRSQYENRRICVERLRALVGKALPPPKKRRKTKPSRAMIAKRLDAKRRQSKKKNARRAGHREFEA